VREYLRAPALPRCLLPFFCHVMSAAYGKHDAVIAAQERDACLLRVLGDLEQVWASKELQDALLGLPLGVVRELLSRTELRVMSCVAWPWAVADACHIVLTGGSPRCRAVCLHGRQPPTTALFTRPPCAHVGGV
jgi:hypothetical protein